MFLFHFKGFQEISTKHKNGTRRSSVWRKILIGRLPSDSAHKNHNSSNTRHQIGYKAGNMIMIGEKSQNSILRKIPQMILAIRKWAHLFAAILAKIFQV